MKIKTAYKQTEIGEIPEDWDCVPLSTITKKITKGIFDLGPEYYVDDGIPYLRISDIRNNRIIFYSGKFISKEKNKEFPTTQLHPGDIVLSKLVSARFGNQIAIIPTFMPICNLNQNLIGIKLDLTQIDSSYLLYFLKYKKTSNFLISRSTGTTQKMIRLNVMRNLYIPLPKLDIQRKITGILSTVDDAFQKTDEIIQKTQLLKNGFMHKLLTAGINHTKFKQTEIGEIPEEWEIENILELFYVKTGTTPSTKNDSYWKDGTVNWLTPADMSKTNGKLHIENSKRKITEKALKETNLNLMPIGSILLSTRAPVGYVAILDNPSTFNQGCKGLVPRDKSINSEFFAYYLTNKRSFLENISSGSTFKELTKNSLESLSLPCPPISEQQKIVSILSEIDDKIELETKRKEHYENLKQGLMNDLLTGKKRVVTT